MNTEARQYKDVAGNPATLDWLVKNEPEWAANQIRHRDKIEAELKDAIEWRDKWKACTEQATLVHEEISRITGIKCLPSQMPRFLADRINAMGEALNEQNERWGLYGNASQQVLKDFQQLKASAESANDKLRHG